MKNYSVAVTLWGWTIKDMDTGKVLSGKVRDMPFLAYQDLWKFINLEKNIVCQVRNIVLPESSNFTAWFGLAHTRFK